MLEYTPTENQDALESALSALGVKTARGIRAELAARGVPMDNCALSEGEVVCPLTRIDGDARAAVAVAISDAGLDPASTSVKFFAESEYNAAGELNRYGRSELTVARVEGVVCGGRRCSDERHQRPVHMHGYYEVAGLNPGDPPRIAHIGTLMREAYKRGELKVDPDNAGDGE